MGDDEGHHHRLDHLILHRLFCCPHSVLVALLLKRLVHVVSRSDLQVDNRLSPVASRVASKPRQVELPFRSCDPTFVLPLTRPQVFGPDRDFVSGSHHHLPLYPLLRIGDKSSLGVDVLQEDVPSDVVASVVLSRYFLATADNVFRIKLFNVLLHQHFVGFLPYQLFQSSVTENGSLRFPESPSSFLEAVQCSHTLKKSFHSTLDLQLSFQKNSEDLVSENS